MKNRKSENLGTPPLKNSDSSLSVSDTDEADTLNSYFHSVFTQEQMPVSNTGTSPFPSISDLQISPEGMCKQLSQLNPKKACGPDNQQES